MQTLPHAHIHTQGLTLQYTLPGYNKVYIHVKLYTSGYMIQFLDDAN